MKEKILCYKYHWELRSDKTFLANITILASVVVAVVVAV